MGRFFSICAWRAVLGAALVAVAGASVGGCGTVGHDERGISNFDQVSETLYRGGQPSAAGYRTLARYNIKTVINLRDADDTQEARAVKAAGMAYVRLPLAAETVTAEDARRILATVAAAEGPVFVHCYVGRDRTGLAVAAYRVLVQGWSQQAALKDMYAHGHMWALYPQVKAAVLGLSAGPMSASAAEGRKEAAAEAGSRMAQAKSPAKPPVQ